MDQVKYLLVATKHDELCHCGVVIKGHTQLNTIKDARRAAKYACAEGRRCFCRIPASSGIGVVRRGQVKLVYNIEYDDISSRMRQIVSNG